MIFLMLAPIYAVAASDIDFTNQMLDSEIERLTKQRDEKFAALQKCEETTKGFKIAGIATLAATGVGIYGNIKLSQKLKGKGSKKSGGGSGLNAKVLTAAQSKTIECDDCFGEGNYTGDQCTTFMDCWAKRKDIICDTEANCK